jgi:hypothetical protein
LFPPDAELSSPFYFAPSAFGPLWIEIVSGGKI